MERLPFPPPRPTGLASSCDDFARCPLEIHEKLVIDPTNTLLVRMVGDAMKHRRVMDGDLLVIERRQSYSPNQIVLAGLPGDEFVLRNLETRRGRAVLCAGADWPVIELNEEIRLIGLLRWSATSHCGLRIADLPGVS